MTNTSVTIKGQSLIAGLLLFVQMGCWSGSTDINYNISSTGYNFVYNRNGRYECISECNTNKYVNEDEYTVCT